MKGAPFVYCTSPGEGDQAGHNGSDEDQVSDDIDASELMLPSRFTLIFDVQKHEEADEGDCSKSVRG